MTQSIEITVRANPDLDDCLAGAAEAYISEHPELTGYDLAPRWADEDDREDVVLTVPLTFDVVAGTASPTTTGVEGGIDVDFTLTLNGVEHEGEVTLLPHEDGRPGYSSWGAPDNWVDSRTLRAIRDLDRDVYSDILDAILAETSPEAKAFAASR